MYIEHLNNDLTLLYINKEKIDIFIGLFNKYVLCNQSDIDKELFYSLTIHGKEISLIVDSSIAKYFESIKQIAIPNYKIVKIFNNEDGIDDVGIINKISLYFKKNNISILYINSFNNNYIIYEDTDKNAVCSILDDLVKDEEKEKEKENYINNEHIFYFQEDNTDNTDNNNDHDNENDDEIIASNIITTEDKGEDKIDIENDYLTKSVIIDQNTFIKDIIDHDII